jgi:hypothetical protein
MLQRAGELSRNDIMFSLLIISGHGGGYLLDMDWDGAGVHGSGVRIGYGGTFV